MLQLISYFEGHGGAVTALAKGVDAQSFFSAGSEGLIVEWNLNKLNEGEVILKLPGLIPALWFDAVEKLIYTTINHKGLFVIDPAKRKVLHSVELPGASFNRIAVGINFIITSTHFGELLVIDRASLKIKHRINTGLSTYSEFVVEDNLVCYSSSKGIVRWQVDDMDENKIPFTENVNGFCLYNKVLIFASSSKIYGFNTRKNKIVFEEPIEAPTYKMIIDTSSNALLIFSKPNMISRYKIGKKSVNLLNATQIEHIGGINDILSIENHKFVISAGIDKKIGVWQLN